MANAFGDLLGPILDNPFVQLTQRLCWLFFIIFTFALVFWTWRDAQRRGAMAFFWAVVVALFNVPGWIIYMVVRPPETLEDMHERDLEIRAREAEIRRGNPTCPACLKPVEKDFLICPSCMKKLKKECVNCARPLDLDWKVCPYCRAQQ